MSRPAVFLDRDGTINLATIRDGRPYPPNIVDDLVIVAGASEALLKLRRAGYLTIMATNQPDVAAGRQRRDVVEAINEALRAQLPLDDIRVCYHQDLDRCDCRKPKPGMLLEAAHDWSIDLGRSFMVGDRWRDVEAGRAAGCRTVLIEAGYDERRAVPDFSAASLVEACDIILKVDGSRRPACGR